MSDALLSIAQNISMLRDPKPCKISIFLLLNWSEKSTNPGVKLASVIVGQRLK